MNDKSKAPVWLYLFLVLALFIGWLFVQVTNYDTHEVGIALIALLMIFGVTAVSLNVYIREGHNHHNSNPKI